MGEWVLTDTQRAAMRRLAERHGWELVVLFGSVARDGTGRDLDLAVLPGGAERRRGPDLFRHGRWQRELEEALEPWRVDVLVLSDRLSPVTRQEVFRDGICLYEAETGRFEQEQDRALFLYMDSAFLRERARGAREATEQ